METLREIKAAKVLNYDNTKVLYILSIIINLYTSSFVI